MSSAQERFSVELSKRQATCIKPPPRLVLYGEVKIGKTTFATSAPNVCLIATEDGALAVDVPRLPTDGKCKTWQDVLDCARALRDDEHDFKWAALDTANGAEALCQQMVVARDFDGHLNPGKGHDGFSAYGKGDKAVAQEYRALLAILDDIQQKRGVGVILLAHAGLHKTGNALGADFQKFGADMNKNTWALVAGWADQIGYACREMRVSIRDGEIKAKANAIGAERWIKFEGGPGLDAGGRVGYEMPEKILLSWDDYAAALKTDHVASLLDQVKDLLARAPEPVKAKVMQRLGGKVTDKALREVGKAKLEALIGWLLTQTEKAANTNGHKEAA
jgi:hypothetical protein